METVKFDNFFKIFLAALLGIISYFLMQTFATIKNLEKAVISIRDVSQQINELTI